MNQDFAVEDRFRLLCGINRAAHFEWRRAALALNPEADPLALVLRYWQEVGHDTARAYLKMIDRERPVAPQVAELVVKSSLAMGETAETQPGERDEEALVVHRGCPWLQWHQRNDALPEDRPGCDQWLQTIADDVSEALGITLRCQTLEALPDGAPTCTRRLWVEE
jgi:hypothetical protein